MLTFYTNVNRILPCFNMFARPFCVKKSKTVVFDFAVKYPFSPEEHVKILKTLNESTPDTLSRYKISYTKIKDMSDWKQKRGPFKCLSEVLEVKGFGEKMLEDICKNIVYNNVSEVKGTSSKRKRPNKHLLTPEIDIHLFNSLQSAVAIHLDPTGVGWTKLEKASNNLHDWKCKTFRSLPTKMLPLDTFNLAIDIVRATPTGDAYIFEAPLTLGPQSKQEHVSSYNQQIELISMLLALINTSVQHNQTLQNHSKEEQKRNIENRVFFLKSRTPARVFNTLLGYEKVSAISKIMGLMQKDPQVLQSLPCTPVTSPSHLNNAFMKGTATNKELLAQALMLGVSFMELVINRNAQCFEALKPNRHREM